jgi:hypothetical protein
MLAAQFDVDQRAAGLLLKQRFRELRGRLARESRETAEALPEILGDGHDDEDEAGDEDAEAPPAMI